ncbi:ParA family protein [Poseidonibacter ostreae]|uniref:AAA family ATPase n=1 Tax=Poseidonibacter ostreae TaxID=2654171 RepID=A0A6L4WZA7_9BACT|nr:AAA family ATPase [Poseidonibacter ostreae]KAB7891344.1 AAA family ATPase [Poseidonibacter ostreae]
MDDKLKFRSDKPTLRELAPYCNVKGESAVRYIRDNNRELFIQGHRDFLSDKAPFVSVRDYVFLKYPEIYVGDKIEWIELEIKKLEKDRLPVESLKKELEAKIKAVDTVADTIIEKVNRGELIGTFYDNGIDGKILYLPTNGEELKELLDGLDEIKTDGKARVISIGNHKGGVAKTTSIVNLGATLKFMGKKVLLCDMDSQGNCTSGFGYVREDFENTLIELLIKLLDDDFEEVLNRSIIRLDTDKYFDSNSKGKLDLLGNSAVVEELTEELPIHAKNLGTLERVLSELLGYVDSDYDYILIDLPPRLDLILRMAIVASNYFVFSLTAEAFAEKGIPSVIAPIVKTSKRFKRDMRHDFEILGGINNRYESNINSFIQNKVNSDNLLKENLGEDRGLLRTDVNKNKVFNESAMMGVGSALFLEPCNRAVRNYFDLTEDILEKMLEVEMTNLSK